MTNFETALDFTLRWEGGYADHPADRGGATNRGITSRTLAAAHRSGLVAHNNIRQLTKDEAAAIYRVNYWERSHADILASPLCIAHFDACVNNGIGSCGRFLQRMLNLYGAKLSIDGIIGKQTLASLKTLAGADIAVCTERYNDFREKFFRSIVKNRPSQRVFLKGWLNRLAALRRLCAAIAETAVV